MCCKEGFLFPQMLKGRKAKARCLLKRSVETHFEVNGRLARGRHAEVARNDRRGWFREVTYETPSRIEYPMVRKERAEGAGVSHKLPRFLNRIL